MRLFFAIELPPEVRERLGGLRVVEARAYRWVDPSLLHVTLAFIGQRPEAALEALQRVGSAAASASNPAILRLGGAGSFGPRREPRVLWVGLDGDVAALLRLQARLAAELRGAGFGLEDRPFAPHITLARRRDGAPSGRRFDLDWTSVRSGSATAQFTMDHLTLMESRLSPRGPTYIPRLEFPLGRGV